MLRAAMQPITTASQYVTKYRLSSSLGDADKKTSTLELLTVGPKFTWPARVIYMCLVA